MDERFNQFIPQVHFELIPIRNLVSNQEYQRSISEKQVLHAAENFDVNQINPVKVSRRNGMNYVFNGQHTIEIVAMVSGSRDTPVWCMIYDDLEYTLQWQRCVDGENWTDIQGETGEFYHIILTEENCEYLWRVQVHIKVPDDYQPEIEEPAEAPEEAIPQEN